MSTTPGYDASGITRPYRSQKRQRPCDRCRERKLKCQTDGEPPCQRCQRNNIECTFVGKPRRRVALPREVERAGSMDDEHISLNARRHGLTLRARAHEHSHSSTISSSIDDTAVAGSEEPLGNSGSGAAFTHHEALGTPVLAGLHPHRPSTQLSQSLDQIQNHTAQLLGGSSESDPWLLRHCRFDELGLRSFHKVHYRHAGGVPTRDKIPVHFLLSDDELCEGAAAETRVNDERELRAELDVLVPSVYGARLVRL